MSMLDVTSREAGSRPALILIALGASLEDCAEDQVKLARICRLLPGVAVVVLSDGMSVKQCTDAMRAGASGYLLRDITPEGLKQSLSLVLTGEKVLPTDFVKILLEGRARDDVQSGEADDRDNPSPREKLILQCLANGYSNKAIAAHLDISEATVKVHIKTVFRKIRVQNRTEAAIWALSNGYQSEMQSMPFRSARRSLESGLEETGQLRITT